MRAGDDRDGVPVLERAVQRRDAPVHLGALAAVSDFRVDGEREVDGSGPRGQALHVALRGEDEDLVLVEIDLQELEELLR